MASEPEPPYADRMQDAGVKAVDAWARVGQMAEEIDSEIDDITIPHSVAVTDLPKSDPLVVATAKALAVGTKR